MAAVTAPTPDATETVRIAESPHARSLASVVTAVIVVLAAMYFARTFLIPVACALLLSLVLAPPVRTLARWHVPPPAGAAVILGACVVILGLGTYHFAPAVRDWVSVAPARARVAMRRIRTLTARVERVTSVADQVAAAVGADERSSRTVVVQGPSLTQRLYGTTQAIAIGCVEVLLLLYSLLAVGDLFLQKLVEALPRLRDAKKAVTIAREAEASISSYLFLTAMINVSEGALVAAALALLHMPSALLWGAAVAVAEFVPYLGMIAVIGVLTIASLSSFDSTWHALAVPAAYLVINFVQGNVVTPLVMSRRLTLNPVAIFISLAFWWWMWGIAGALLAVPLLATFKIFCDHVEALSAIGAFLGERDKSEKRRILR
jgi:predicted PurR-regulated permease PerM